jgi:GNAT superfamily N-acetyltransferase
MSGILTAPFRPELAGAFRQLNLDWIERLFAVEPADRKVLDDPERAIIQPGGMIYFALDGERPVGTVAMILVSPGRYELAKMAVASSHQRRGIGEQLGAVGIEWAGRLPADKQPARWRDPAVRTTRVPPCGRSGSVRVRAGRRLYGTDYRKERRLIRSCTRASSRDSSSTARRTT